MVFIFVFVCFSFVLLSQGLRKFFFLGFKHKQLGIKIHTRSLGTLFDHFGLPGTRCYVQTSKRELSFKKEVQHTDTF